jgi:hypothetical protein
MYHMSNDSNLFGGSDDLSLPLYEAKMIHQFDHRWATYDSPVDEARDVSIQEKKDPLFEPKPQYWVAASDVEARLLGCDWHHSWLLGWRRISGVEKVRTVISTVMPRSAVGDSIFVLLPDKSVSPYKVACLSGCLSSLPLDYAARNKMGGTNLNYYILEQLPVLPPKAYSQDCIDFIAPRVLELTYTSESMTGFARDLGYDGPPFAWDEDRRALLRAELDAWYAHAYGLSRDELRYIIDPKEIMGSDYPSESFRVLKEREEKSCGEYRTQRLVLDAWDRMEKGELHRPAPYQRVLSNNPPMAVALSRRMESIDQPSLQFAEADPE